MYSVRMRVRAEVGARGRLARGSACLWTPLARVSRHTNTISGDSPYTVMLTTGDDVGDVTGETVSCPRTLCVSLKESLCVF